MKKIYQPTPAEVAAMTVALVTRYTKERDKEVTRFRLARSSLRRMAIRDQLRDVFIDEWISCLLISYGWAACGCGDEFLLIRADTTKGWTKLGTARMDDVIKPLRKGDRTALDALDDEIDDSEPGETDDD